MYRRKGIGIFLVLLWMLNAMAQAESGFHTLIPDPSKYVSVGEPFDVAVARNGSFYVLAKNSVIKFNSDGNFVLEWGKPGNNNGEFNQCGGIAIDGDGNVYVVDNGNNRIQKFSSNGIFLGKWGVYGSADGKFIYPEGIAIDGNDNIYIADTGNSRIQKFGKYGGLIMP